jgi:hypothetical protein
MIILGGEPPFIENPAPRFGEVIKKFNKLTYAIQLATEEFNRNNAEKLETIGENVDIFVDTVAAPIDVHLDSRGAQHGETRASIGLSKKDNFRTATKAEQIALAPVQAFVTPEGAKASLVANNASFVLADYQLNDLYQFASFFYPDQYPIPTPTRVEPVRYFGASKKTGLLLNADRLIFSPYSDTAQYLNQSIFTSMPLGGSKGAKLGETVGLSSNFLTASWNTVGCDAADGSTAFFKPLADKQIYQYKNNLAMPGSNKNYLLYSLTGSATYKGLAVSVAPSGPGGNTVLALYHKFFYTANPGTDPTLVELVSGSYSALFNRMDTATYSGPANGSQAIPLANYVNLPAGATVEISGGSHGIVTTLMWNVVNAEMYLHVAVPVTARLGGVSRPLVFSFMMSIIPGSLLAGGGASFTMLGTRTPDTLGPDLLPVGTANYFQDGNQFDLLNLVQYPGAMLTSGELVKACSTKNGMRVKRFATAYKGLKDFLLAKRPTVDPKLAVSEVYAPSRHACFGLLPERILPYTNGGGQSSFLVYGANSKTGRFGWQEFGWTSDSIVSTQSGDGTFGIRLPDSIDDNENMADMPASMSVYVNQVGVGAAPSALVFNENNHFVGKSTFQFTNHTLTVGPSVALAVGSVMAIKAASGSVMARAAAANPAQLASYRVPQIQVFGLTNGRAVLVISDGLCYAEAAVVGLVVNGSTATLDFTLTNGLKLKPVTAGGQPAMTGNRTSASGDDVWLTYSDLLAVYVAQDTFQVVVTRAFGNVYGDLSFTINGFATATPSFVNGTVNKARLYQRNDAFDTVEELYPPLLLAGKGVYQHVPANTRFTTLMNEVGGGAAKIDPFNVNEAGWVRLPAGSRVVLNGRTTILDRDYAVKVGTSGTYYCYLQRLGTTLIAVASPVPRQPVNNEVLFGIATNGVLVLQKNYIVMDSKSISPTRHGSAVPYFADNGGQGVNQFFTARDVKA